MQRYDFYFLQKVTEAELDAAFDAVEAVENRIYSDIGIRGVVSGASVNEAATPNLTVDVSAGVVVDQNGQRIRWSSIQNVDVSVDENSTSTAVGTPGNSKYLSIFAKFLRVNSDPRVDGEQATVFFNSAESFELRVAQGAEAGSPTPPSLRSDQILLADILLDYGETTIEDSDIDTSRREWVVKTSGVTPSDIEVGTFAEAIQELADRIDAANDAAGVAYAGSGNWADGTPLSATNVEAALDEIVADLADKTGAGADGAGRVGAAGQTSGSFSVSTADISAQLLEILGHINTVNTFANSGNWHDGTGISATDVEAAINEVKNDIASEIAGSDKIGSPAQSSGSASVTAGSVKDQIGEILSELNALKSSSARLLAATNIMRIPNLASSGYDLRQFRFGANSSGVNHWYLVADTGAAAESKIAVNGLGTWTAGNAFSGTPTEIHDIVRTYNTDDVCAIGKKAVGATLQVNSNPRIDVGSWSEASVSGTTNAGDIGMCLFTDTDGDYTLAGYYQGSAGTGTVIARSNAVTSSWSPATTVPAALRAVYQFEENAGTIIAVGEDSSGNAMIVRSTDDGDTWSTVTMGTAGTSGAFWGVAYDPTRSRWWVAGTGTNGIHYSTDDGLNWTRELVGDFNGIGVDGDGYIVACREGASNNERPVWSDDGNNWNEFSLFEYASANSFSKMHYELGQTNGSFTYKPRRWVYLLNSSRDILLGLHLDGSEG